MVEGGAAAEMRGAANGTALAFQAGTGPKSPEFPPMLEPLASIVEQPAPPATVWRFMDFTKDVAMGHERALFFARRDSIHVGMIRYVDRPAGARSLDGC